jgi:NADP-dependent 3-hydroxy acid dehydrogenase YdfG
VTSLTRTVALVTGASSGIGSATAVSLAASGAAVALAARRADRLDHLAEKIRADGGIALPVPTDLTDPGQARGAVERVAEQLGRLDILVNNAGMMLLGPALESETAEWDRMVAINVQALLHVTHAALPHLVAAAKDSPRQVADLVNISSTAGRLSRAGGTVYSLTKTGVTAFSEALRQELIPQGVRVSVIEPGTVDTEIISHLRDGVREWASNRVASIDPMRPEDVADAVSYIVTRDRRVAVNELVVRASQQTW